VPDDGGVDQQIQRLGGQHDQRGKSESEHRRSAAR
jgi:hypothetical protein